MKRPSIYFTAILAKFNIKPNTISIARIFLCLFSIPLFYTGHIGYVVLGVLLLHLALISDCVDGELARLYETNSLEGSFIDSVTSALIPFSVFTGSALLAYKLSGSVIPLIILIFLLGTKDFTSRSRSTILLKLILGGNTSLSPNDRGKNVNLTSTSKKRIRKNNLFNLIKKILRIPYRLYSKICFILLNGLYATSIISIIILISMFFSEPRIISLMLFVYLFNSLQSSIIGAINIVKNKGITKTIDNLIIKKQNHITGGAQ